MISCHTPGCATPVPEGDEDRAFCERCGWPLAEGRVEHAPEVLRFRGAAPERLTLRVHNSRLGRLKWEIREPPSGVRVVEEPSAAPPFSAGQAVLEVDPSGLADEAGLPLTLRLWDRAGQAGYDLRQDGVDACWRDVELRVPARREQYGPLVVPWKSLLFGNAVIDASVTARNAGQAEMAVTAEVTPGYLLQAVGQPKSERLQVTVPGGQSWTVTVSRRPDLPPAPGRLTLQAPDLRPAAVDLVPKAFPPPPPPAERRVVAIDFGTTKSAVMVFDQRVRGASPEAVTWQLGGAEHPWLPSAVAWDNDVPTRFGWQVEFLEAGPHIVRSIKTRLREDDPRVRRSVVYFLRRLFDQTAGRYGGEVFANARVIFSLPVLDNGTGYEEQRKRTLELALEAAGERYGLHPDQCDFYQEPECAAVDFLHHLFEQDEARRAGALPAPTFENLKDGDWICVLDIGGGTTDISFARLAIDATGAPAFTTMQTLGFADRAGDCVDREIYRFCVTRWISQNRLKGIEGDARPLSALGLDDLVQAPGLLLEGEKTPVRRDEALRQLCILKENVFGQSPPVNKPWDIFVLQHNHVLLSPNELSLQIRKRVAEPMFNEVQDAFDAWGIAPTSVKLLCLTGGTSHIPVFEETLREKLMLHPANTRAVQIPGRARLNVVAGAARRPGLRIPGLLPLALHLSWGQHDRRELIAKGTMPGAVKKVEWTFNPAEEMDVELHAVIPDDETRTLFSYRVKNRLLESLALEAQARYLPGRVLQVRLVWLTIPEEEALPWTTVQVVP